MAPRFFSAWFRANSTSSGATRLARRKARFELESLEDRALLAAGLVISAANGVFPEFSLAQPPNSVGDVFGANVVTLSTGNIVVTADDPPAAFLYNGETGALISTLTGTGALGFGVTALTNGNYVLTDWSEGTATATWASGTTGISGTVSATNSLVAGGGVSSAGFKVIPLANGNYVVDFAGWNRNTGAVTWGNGTTGTVGTLSAANSLIGSNLGDLVGGNEGLGGVTALPSGNYIVNSPSWNNDEGAVTWGNGATGVTGTISSANSLIGWSDSSGAETVTALANGNYLAADSGWNGGEGVVTWGSGISGVYGVVSADDSLVGSQDDFLGEYVVPLTNGNFVASGTGTATWGNGTGAISETVSAGNSLVGGGSRLAMITALTDGNYVVDFPGWTSSAGLYGAVTWGNGSTGTTGMVSPDNSLVSSNIGDVVGIGNDGGGVTALANGNYVVASPGWNGEEGATTWVNGSNGQTSNNINTVSSANSLTGTSRPSNSGFTDQVGSGGITALTNGNYVVDSPQWYGNTGASTWGNGATGTVGSISASNSQVGSSPGDLVGQRAAIPLSNGNYVVDIPTWNNNTGAVTWGDGTTGVVGVVSAANSLVGSSEDDEVGSSPVTVLPNGNYVVVSPYWNQGAGAVTWGNGSTGTLGAITVANSLIDIPSLVSLVAGEARGASGVVVFPNGNYVFCAATGYDPDDPFDPGLSTVTWFDGSTGATLDGENSLDPQNTIYGQGGGPTIQAVEAGSSFVCSLSLDSSEDLWEVEVGITDPDQLGYALGQGQTITVAPSFLTRTLNAGSDVTMQASDDISIDSPITESPTGSPGSLTLEAGRSILINASINTAGGNLSLIANDSVADGVVNSDRDPGNANITMTSGASLDTGSGSLLVDLKQSTDKTNNGRGEVTLLGVNANAITLPAGTPLGFSINGTTPGDGVAAGTYAQLDVSGSINLDNSTLQVSTSTAFAAGTTFTIVQSGAGVSGVFDGLPQGSQVVAPDGSEFTISYQADAGKAVVLTALGPGTTPPQVTGVSPTSGPTSGGTLVTITGSNLAGATAVDFGSDQVTSFVSDTADQIVLSSPAGTGMVEVTVVTPSGTSAPSSADQFSYVSSPVVPTRLSAVSGNGTSGGTATLTSTLTANGLPLAGRTVTFTLSQKGTVKTVGMASTNASGVATLSDVSLSGLNAGTYSGIVGASFAGDSTYSGSSASGPLIINGPLYIIGEQPVFDSTTNKKGKLVGKSTLEGYIFEFSAPLNPSSATNVNNYQVDTFTNERFKREILHVLHPLTGFSVAYGATSNSVTLTLAGKQTFPTGGQIKVVSGPSGGVTGSSGDTLAGTTVFTISPGGRRIGPQ